MVRFFTFSMYHAKGNVGSTRLRVEQLINYWPEADLYKYGENPDVMIYQKVYVQPDWLFMKHFKGIQILDVCDPDWLDGVGIRDTVDSVDGVTCATEPLAEFIRQLTDKPVIVIPDRHDLREFKKQAKHSGPIKSVVWFGYKHNAEALRWAMNFLARKDIHLTVISNEDPMPHQWADSSEKSKELYTFQKFEAETLNEELAKHDAALLPVSSRPEDRFKSNNRTVIAWLSGLPIITDDASFERLDDPKLRQAEATKLRAEAEKDYDVRLSVSEMQAFISALASSKTQSKLDQAA